jgi:hypothetical protein
MSHTYPIPIRFFRAMLALYPAEFRQEYGSEIIEAFGEKYRGLKERRRWLALLGLWLESISDLAGNALLEHLDVLRKDIRDGMPPFCARRYLRRFAS